MCDEGELIKASVNAAFAPFADLINKIAGPAAGELGLTFQDTVRVFRLKRQIRLLERAQEMLRTARVVPKKIPLKILLPIIENASLEEDNVLQDRWAALLANNAAGAYAETVFPEILRQLSAADAYLLRMCFHEIICAGYHRMMPPWGNLVNQAVSKCGGPHPGTPPFPISDLSVENLIRLGLMTRTVQKEHGGMYDYKLSVLGYRFISACEDPAVLEKAEEAKKKGERQFEDFP